MIIYVKGVSYELPLNGFEIPYTKTIDSTFDSAHVETMPLPADYVEGLDLSKRLPRLAEVRFEHKGITYQMMVAEPTVEQVEYDEGLFIHKLDLVSFTKDLTGFPLENMTLTQPKGDLGEYTRSANTVSGATLMNLSGDYEGTRGLQQSSQVMTIGFNNTINTNTSKLNGLHIIALEDYNVSLDLVVLYKNTMYANSVTVKIKYGTAVIEQRTLDIPTARFSGFWTNLVPARVEDTFNLRFKPTASDYLSVEVTANVGYVKGDLIYDDIFYQTADLNITSYVTYERPYKTYAQLASKMLRNTPYSLSDNARARLNVLAPEGKFEGYTVYDGLSKIAAELGALVTVKRMTVEREIVPTTEEEYTNATEKYDLGVGENIYDKSPYDYRLGTVFRQAYNPSVLRWVTTGALSMEEGTITPGTECYVQGATGVARFGMFDNYYEVSCDLVLSDTISYMYYIVSNTERPIREVDFLFFDKPRLRTRPNVSDYMILAELEDYVNAVQLNTKNVVDRVRHSPFKDGFGILSSGDIDRISTSNITYQCEDNIETITKVLIKGLASQSANYTWTADDVTDITDHVLLEDYYNTLDSDSDYTLTGKGIFKQSNCLYYRKGDRRIYGMSFTGEHAPTLIGQPSVTRALYETILAKRSKEVGELVTRTGTQSADDPGLTGDLNIQIYVEYQALTETHARVYKDDQTGFERPRIKYMNESSNVNKSESLGDYAQVLVNRLGGSKYTYNGWADDIDDIPQVGDIDEDGKMCVVMNYSLGEKVYYSGVYVQDYNVISSYIGMNSRHRIEEISADDTVLRVLRYTSKVVFVDSLTAYTTRLRNEKRLFRILSGEAKTPVSYGYLECNHANGVKKKIHLSLDTDSKGKTLEIKFQLKDNYSAGLKRYSKVIGGQTVYFNREVSYSDYYGKVDNILFKGYMGYNAFDSTERALYPEATADKGFNPIFEIEDIIDKDAREVLAGLVEIPIMSESSNIRVYNGFAKHNFIADSVANVQLGLLKYIPPRNAVKVDLSKVVSQSATVTTFNDGYVSVSVTPSEICRGLVWYDRDTLDLILAYVDWLDPVAQSINLYYEVRDD